LISYIQKINKFRLEALKTPTNYLELGFLLWPLNQRNNGTYFNNLHFLADIFAEIVLNQ
jgi:hypothetical protein